MFANLQHIASFPNNMQGFDGNMKSIFHRVSREDWVDTHYKNVINQVQRKILTKIVNKTKETLLAEIDVIFDTLKTNAEIMDVHTYDGEDVVMEDMEMDYVTTTCPIPVDEDIMKCCLVEPVVTDNIIEEKDDTKDAQLESKEKRTEETEELESYD